MVFLPLLPFLAGGVVCAFADVTPARRNGESRHSPRAGVTIRDDELAVSMHIKWRVE
jgi:hypothetical protein